MGLRWRPADDDPPRKREAGMLTRRRNQHKQGSGFRLRRRQMPILLAAPRPAAARKASLQGAQIGRVCNAKGSSPFFFFLFFFFF